MAINVKTRNVSITLENEAFIADCVASGRFANSSEVIRAGLRLLEVEERRLALEAGRPSRRPSRPTTFTRGK